MRRCQSQIRNPTSQISQLGRVSHLSHASQMFAMFPMFPVFPMFAVFAMFPVFPRTRDARKKTKHQEMRNSVSEARASARAHLRTWNLEFRTRNLLPPRPPKRRPPLLVKEGSFRNPEFSEAGTESPRRFTRFKCFKCFRRFISFVRFNRFRNVWPLQKMKHPDPNIGTRVPDLK